MTVNVDVVIGTGFRGCQVVLAKNVCGSLRRNVGRNVDWEYLIGQSWSDNGRIQHT